MRKLATTIVLSSLPFAAIAWSQEPTPLGDQFQVNTYTTSGQSGQSLAVDPLGNFVVVWESTGSYGTDTSGGSIQAQRYDAGGNPLMSGSSRRRTRISRPRSTYFFLDGSTLVARTGIEPVLPA